MCSVSGGRQGSNFCPSAGCTVGNGGPFEPDMPGSGRSLKENYWCRVDTGRGEGLGSDESGIITLVLFFLHQIFLGYCHPHAELGRNYLTLGRRA